MSRLIAVVGVLVSGVAVSCGDGDPPPDPCVTDSECRADRRCVDGECVPRVDGGADGDGGGRPDAGPREDAGADATGQRCGDARPCPAGFVCEGGLCAIDCGERARCVGACCGDGDVCHLGACTTPGGSCTGAELRCVPARCPAGQQCDPSIGRCLPVPADASCELTPAGTFEPVVLWEWGGSSAAPAFRHVIATPVIADLDGDGASDVVVPVSDFLPGGPRHEGGILCALAGAGDCEGGPRELWCTSPGELRVNAVASAAIADLDGDGELTIVAPAARSGAIGDVYGIYGYDAAGRRIGTFGTDEAGTPVDVLVYVGAPSIADLDADGRAEVVVGYHVFDADGRLVWSRPGALGNAGFGPMTVVAQLDGVGDPEIIGGNMAYHSDGSEAWAAGTDARAFSDGWPAVGDLDGDGAPEVVVVSEGRVRVFDRAGRRFAAADATVDGFGGPPTIADIDGDGAADIAVAGQNSLTVFEVGAAPDHPLTVLWRSASRDLSSNITGSSVFDFDGDGRAEVIYADECFARVYDGVGDGAGGTSVRFEVPNTSCTGTEYPVVADVTGDGRAEFVVVANDFSGTASACSPYVQGCITAFPGYVPNAGVRVYRDRLDNWVTTRAVWNQHSYHVTNVCDGRDRVCPPGEDTHGRVPRVEPDSWGFPAESPLNAYRVNSGVDDVLSAPDLVPRELALDLSSCPESLGIRVAVTNIGAVGARAGIDVAVYFGETLVGTGRTTSVLLPGGSQRIRVDWAGLPDEASTDGVQLRVVVDDDGAGVGAINECDELNNEARVDALCVGLL